MPSDYIHTYANGCIRPLAFPTGFDSPGHHDPPRSSFMNALPPVRLDVRSSGTGKGYWSTSTYCTPHTAPHTDKLCRHSWALLRWAVPNWHAIPSPTPLAVQTVHLTLCGVLEDERHRSSPTEKSGGSWTDVQLGRKLAHAPQLFSKHLL